MCECFLLWINASLLNCLLSYHGKKNLSSYLKHKNLNAGNWMWKWKSKRKKEKMYHGQKEQKKKISRSCFLLQAGSYETTCVTKMIEVMPFPPHPPAFKIGLLPIQKPSILFILLECLLTLREHRSIFNQLLLLLPAITDRAEYK